METIAAQATPRGMGGIGVIRVSGPAVPSVMKAVLKQCLAPRHATFLPFYDHKQVVIDQGIALYFPNPHSFTGEDVLELQAHGGPVLQDRLLQSVLAVKQGTRLARPGEFSERAFLNGKMDLAQAEAVSDLIQASSEQAVTLAARTLQGVFSKRVDALQEGLSTLRMFVEAMLDFAEEAIEPLSRERIDQSLLDLKQQGQTLIGQAHQGVLLQEGMKIVLLGAPNVGKSSLLNALLGCGRAIVSDQAGTTRDIVEGQIQIDGMPVHLLDTAGVRETVDAIECEGIQRTQQALNDADRIVWLLDASRMPLDDVHALQKGEMPLSAIHWPTGLDQPITAYQSRLTLVLNKIDQCSGGKRFVSDNARLQSARSQALPCLCLSATHGMGLSDLRAHFKQCMGLDASVEGVFMARRRHLDALLRGLEAIKAGGVAWKEVSALELLAEHLRDAQKAFATITGTVSADDLLGKIFSEFCIGK